MCPGRRLGLPQPGDRAFAVFFFSNSPRERRLPMLYGRVVFAVVYFTLPSFGFLSRLRARYVKIVCERHGSIHT